MSIPTVNADIIPCRDEPGWLSERRKRIQASDASRILAENEAYPVYADKVSPALISDTPERFKIKLAAESMVREIYQGKFGGKVHAWPAYTIAASKEHPWLGCTPDSLVEDPTQTGVGIHQIKCWSEMDRGSWQVGPPLYVQVQTQIEMLCCGVEWGVIAVMFGTQTLERFYVKPNPKFLEVALPLLRDVYTCIELRTPPPIDGSYATTAALAQLHPDDNGLSVHLPEGADEMLAARDRIRVLIDELDKRQSAIENELRKAIGGNTYGLTPGGKWVSWKSQTKQECVVSESTFRVLRVHKSTPKELRGGQIEFADGDNAIDFRVANRIKLPKWLKVKLLNQSNRCKWCGCTLTIKTATFEHVVALDVGGTNDESNIDLACAECNQKRGNNAALPVSITGRA